MTVTVGIDLASRPAGTAICAIEWDPSPRVAVLMRGVVSDEEPTPLDDKLLLGVLSTSHGAVPAGVTKVAIDAPFGWPVAFVDALGGARPWPGADIGVDDVLTRRRTDRWIRDHSGTRDQKGKVPLSVSTDRIAYPAMRLAHLFDRYEENTGVAVDRTGRTGVMCEAYPDPAVRALGLWPAGDAPRASYKGPTNTGRRRRILGVLASKAPWLAISDAHIEACVRTDDALDALICALVARASDRALVYPVPDDAEHDAVREGWIHLPLGHALDGLC
jgi:hypothetical protein